MNDQAISTALFSLFSVREEPLLISFSQTLDELVPNTMRSYIILSGFSEIAVLGDQGSKMRRFVMNF